MTASATALVRVGDTDRRWLKRPRGRGPAETRLFCFHHAGGNAAAFRAWPDLLDERIEPVAVQLPGRADRFGETPFSEFTPAVDGVVRAIAPLLDRPFACYGVSMGARLAWTVALALRARALPQPVRLFLACEPAPTHDDGSRPWQDRPGGLAGYVRDLGGTPPEVLAEPGLLQALLPTLEADLTALTTAPGRPGVPLDMPIHAFAGTTDPVASIDRMTAWGRETSAGFELDEIVGGHFFDTAGEQRVVRAIAADLAPTPGKAADQGPR